MRFERFIGIDPSLRTGFVALSPYGEVIEMKEIERDGDDPARMSDLIQAVVDAVHDTDFVAIEGFGYASQKGFLLGGIGWGIRIELYRRGIPYVDVAPSLLKKFTGAKGNASKERIAVEVYKRWGFEHDSNNVTDAYVLAQIARARGTEIKLTKFQKDVLDKIFGTDRRERK
jgi:crossover junction endodeoxyribonuclease RuvC